MCSRWTEEWWTFWGKRLYWLKGVSFKDRRKERCGKPSFCLWLAWCVLWGELPLGCQFCAKPKTTFSWSCSKILKVGKLFSVLASFISLSSSPGGLSFPEQFLQTLKTDPNPSAHASSLDVHKPQPRPPTADREGPLDTQLGTDVWLPGNVSGLLHHRHL